MYQPVLCALEICVWGGLARLQVRRSCSPVPIGSKEIQEHQLSPEANYQSIEEISWRMDLSSNQSPVDDDGSVAGLSL